MIVSNTTVMAHLKIRPLNCWIFIVSSEFGPGTEILLLVASDNFDVSRNLSLVLLCLPIVYGAIEAGCAGPSSRAV